MKFLMSFLLSLTFLVSNHNYAFNALGHMIIANIAYKRLTPKAKEKVDTMTQYLKSEYPNINYFYDIAPWPDALHYQKIETYSHWHYIDIPFSNDGTPLKNITDTDNAVWAINKIKPIVSNENANHFERARFLAFLVHIVGDIHQPLHTTSRISNSHPEGDEGGNLYTIKYPANHTISLHQLWDNGFGTLSESASKNINDLTDKITSLYPETFFNGKINELSPDIWAQEGSSLAINFAYSTPLNQIPNSNYIKLGSEITEQQIALAGYRLANLLNHIL